MLKKVVLLLLITATCGFAKELDISAKLSYESINFYNSKQKNSAYINGFGADIKSDKHFFKASYEHAKTDTKQPPMKLDVILDKLFTKYQYKISNNLKVNLNYINILSDNYAKTAHGQSYGAGFTYMYKNAGFNFTQFYTNYNVFDAYQSDFTLSYKFKIQNVKVKLLSITKAIQLKNYKDSSYSNKAAQNYVTSGIKVKLKYKTYKFGAGVYFGKRVFAIMNDGFKIQHRAMEFHKTYGFSISKIFFKKLDLNAQYVYQEADELPANKKDVGVKNLKLIVTYKF